MFLLHMRRLHVASIRLDFQEQWMEFQFFWGLVLKDLIEAQGKKEKAF